MHCSIFQRKQWGSLTGEHQLCEERTSAEGASVEGGEVWGGDIPSPADYEVWENVVSSPAGQSHVTPSVT